MKPLKDYYDNIIAPDSYVAFNYGGQIRFGYVDEIKPRKQYGKTHDDDGIPLVTIKVAWKNNPKCISDIKHPYNLVVLKR